MPDTPTSVPTEHSAECPICLRPLAKPYNCKTLYGVTVCNKCRNGFANRRQAAYLVDSVLYIIVAQLLVLTLARAAIRSSSNPATADLVEVLYLLFGYIVFPFLFTLKDAFNGRSPGKMLFGIHVVDVQTRQPISVWQSIKRNLVLMIPYVGVIGGAVTMMRGQRWGDKWAGTMVTWNKRAFREPFAAGGRLCRSCGYDLTGNTSGRCPECGLELPLPAAVPTVTAQKPA